MHTTSCHKNLILVFYCYTIFHAASLVISSVVCPSTDSLQEEAAAFTRKSTTTTTSSSTRDPHVTTHEWKCPDRSTCCLIWDRNHTVPYMGCIPYSEKKKGVGNCCRDHDPNWEKEENQYRNLFAYGTGCGAGTQCASSSVIEEMTNKTLFYCEEETQSQNEETGRNKTRHPRYILTPSSSEALGHVYGFPISSTHPQLNHWNKKEQRPPVVAYYSNMGSILSHRMNSKRENVHAVVIIVHGSMRNADDYLNVGMTVTRLQTKYDASQVLVIAPRFLAPDDGPVTIPCNDDDYSIYHQPSPSDTNTTITTSSSCTFEPLRWDEYHPVEHTWRYGADALPPANGVSSFDVMDSFLHHFFTEGKNREKAYPNLEQLIVMGHSAGGQYTQRWALLSNSPVWKHTDKSSPSIRVIVANPRSYAYLDAHRMIQGHFSIPPTSKILKCPRYNQWEWGLDDGGLLAPYKDRVLMVHNASYLAHRYASRDVLYLSGADDTEILKGSCEDDDFQGRFRRERSFLFFQSLKAYFASDELMHRRILVPGVGHDHALMFESDVALHAAFADSIIDPLLYEFTSKA